MVASDEIISISAASADDLNFIYGELPPVRVHLATSINLVEPKCFQLYSVDSG